MRRKNFLYYLNRISDKPQKQYGHFGGEKNVVSYGGFEPQFMAQLYTNCALSGVMMRNASGTKAATCCIWQKKEMHFGSGCKENLDQLGYCHLLKADCAGDGYGNCRGLTHGTAGNCPSQQPTSTHGL
jgi:hypothetical protein